ncbi:hypothetical protein JCM16303_006904 [Sporobolomyces ruberrimus]
MLSLTIALSALPLLASAHMSPWMPSMYGVGPNFEYSAGNPVDPIGPGWTTFDDWWFRGPSYRALKPQSNVASQLPAGGSFTMEVACHVAWTSYGWATTEPGSALDACPGDNAGPYHAGDPNSMEIDESLISGCALAIADVENIEDVTMDNLVVFSTNQNCIRQKETTFQIPAKMPKCTGSNCICSWHWLANNGTANYYQTGFNCTITGSPVDATPIAPPSDPVFCKNNPSSCTTGAKRPIYAYNYPSNVPWIGNDDRAGYHASWSFPHDGAQNDIFLAAGQTVNSSIKTNTTSTVNPWFGTPTGAGGAPDLALDVSTATASSSGYGQGPWHAVDGWVNGYKDDGSGNHEQEWAANGQGVGAWLNLAWNSPVTFNQLVLFDRPNAGDQITAANITFSDGSFVSVGTLANDGSANYLNLSSPVTTSSLRLLVTGVSSTTGNAGLSEIEIYSVPVTGFTSTTSVQGLPKIASSAIASSTFSSARVASSSIVQNATSTSVLANSTVAAPTATSAQLNTTSSPTVSTAAPASSVPLVSSSAGPSNVSSSALPISSPIASNTSTPVSSNIVSTSSPVSSPPVSSASASSSTGSKVSPIQAIPVSSASPSSSSFASAASSQSSSTGSTSAASSTQVSASSLKVTTTQASSSPSSSVKPSSSSTSSSAAPISTLVDLARQASATASTQTNWSGQLARGAIDGVIGGYLLGGSYYTTQEWASVGQKAGAWLQLNWPTAQSFNQIVLWDRPNLADQVLAGNVTFADGSGVSFAQLPNDAKTGLTLNFANTISSKSINIYISQVSSTTKNIGLAEVQVYAADASKFASGSQLTPTKAAVVAVPSSASVPASSSSSSIKVSSISPNIVSNHEPTIVRNPKSAAPSTIPSTSSAAAAAPATTSPAVSTSKTTSIASTTSARLAWTRVTNAARAILAQPAWKRDEIEFAEEGVYSSNGTTRHVRDFRLMTE